MRRGFYWVVLICMMFGSVTIVARANTPTDAPFGRLQQFVEPLEQSGGLPTNVFRWNDTIAVARKGLTILYDISDPTAPVEISKIVGFEARASVDSYLYGESASPLEWTVWDIEQPATPVEVDQFRVDGNLFAATEHYLVFSNVPAPAYSDTLVLFDLTTPATPTRAGTWSTNAPQEGIRLKWVTPIENRLIVASYYEDCYHGACNTVYLPVDVVEVSNLAHPVTVGSGPSEIAEPDAAVTQGGILFQIRIATARLFIAQLQGDDVVPIATLDPGLTPQMLTIVGDYLYVASDVTTKILDITDPAQPAEVTTLSMGIGGKVYGTLLFSMPFVTSQGGSTLYPYVRLFDTTDPLSPTERSVIYHIAGDSAAKSDDGLLYLADASLLGSTGTPNFFYLHTVDISNATHPSRVRTDKIDLPDNTAGGLILLEGEYLYVPITNYGMLIYKRPTATTAPLLVHTLTKKDIGEATITDNVLALSSNYGGGGIDIYDISNPENPTLASHFPLGQTEFASSLGESQYLYMFISGSYNDTPRIVNVDISDPTSPVIRGEITNVDTNFRGKAVQNGYLYYMRFESLGIINVNDPTHPLTATIPVPAAIPSFDVQLRTDDSRLYLFNPFCPYQLAIYTLDDPMHPSLSAQDAYSDDYQCDNVELVPNNDIFYTVSSIRGIRTFGFIEAKTQYLPLLQRTPS